MQIESMLLNKFRRHLLDSLTIFTKEYKDKLVSSRHLPRLHQYEKQLHDDEKGRFLLNMELRM